MREFVVNLYAVRREEQLRTTGTATVSERELLMNKFNSCFLPKAVVATVMSIGPDLFSLAVRLAVRTVDECRAARLSAGTFGTEGQVLNGPTGLRSVRGRLPGPAAGTSR